MSNGGLDGFIEQLMERIAIKIDSGIPEIEAARQACQEYGIRTLTHWDYGVLTSGDAGQIARLLRITRAA